MMSLFKCQEGFALPVVLITSIAMMMLLLTSLTASSSVVSSLKNQYYDKLSQEAAESGSLMAERCLRSMTTYSIATTVTLKPESNNCSGGVSVSCALYPANSACYVFRDDVTNPTVRTKFTVSFGPSTATERPFSVTATVEKLGKNGGKTVSTSSQVSKRVLRFEYDPKGTNLAQRYWYFGYGAGLDFGTLDANRNPKPVPSLCLATSCEAMEGATSISSSNGQFQFWTNGIDVWNRTGAIMQYSGAGYTRLNAASSATQASVVFPVRSIPNRYIVVTNNTVTGTKASDNDRGELYYSGIDMAPTSDNGNGMLLFNPPARNTAVFSAATDYANESLSAAPKPDGSGYYVMTIRPSDLAVLTFEFDSNGNRVGTFAAQDSLGTGTTTVKRTNPAISGYGSINFNKDYTKVVIMNSRHCTAGKWATTYCQNNNGLIRVYDYNKSTGVISNRVMWDSLNDVATTGYSADFSPSGKYVYATSIYPGRLYRYDISNPAGTQAYIGETARDTKNYSAQGGGQVRRAPNDKMYVADDTRDNNTSTVDYSRISVIHYPDAPNVNNVGWSYGGQRLDALVDIDGEGFMWHIYPQSRYGLPQTVTVFEPKITVY